MATVRLRNGTGPPPALTLADGEPALDLTPASPKLYVGIGGVTYLLADPAYVAALEARVAALEEAVREIQFKSWFGLPPTRLIP